MKLLFRQTDFIKGDEFWSHCLYWETASAKHRTISQHYLFIDLTTIKFLRYTKHVTEIKETK
jgi:hypothetical protein